MSPHIAIIGGGITGLAAAFALEQKAKEVSRPVSYTLFEADDRFGGKLVTERVDGFVIEGGPDSFLTQKPAALQLCRALGLEDDLIPIQEHRPSSYILHQGQLKPLPAGMNMLAPASLRPLREASLFSLRGKLRIAWERFLPPRTGHEDESLATFVRRRLGDEALTLLAEPIFAGVHVADSERLSMTAAYPRFLALERQYGSLTRAARILTQAGPRSADPPAFLTLRQGLGGLIEALVSRLTGDLRLHETVDAVVPHGDGFSVTRQSSAPVAADAVIVATPASAAATLVEGWKPELARELRQIKTATTATVSSAYNAQQVGHPLRGTGFLVSRREPSRLLGCTWTSSKFADRAPEEMVLLRAFVGGHRSPELMDLDDEALVGVVRQELRQIMGITAQPVLTRIYRWFHAHPQYEVGHLERVDAMEHLCPPGLRLAGASYRGLGLPDCIAQGEGAAAALLDEVIRLPTRQPGTQVRQEVL